MCVNADAAGGGVQRGRAEQLIFIHDKNWPASTLEPCAHDMHTFKGKPYGIPVAYHLKTHQYEMLGFFCTPACALASMQEKYQHEARYKDRLALFRSFYATAHNLDDVQCAPPLALLRKMIAEARSALGENYNEEKVVDEWRNNSHLYCDLREVDGLFVRVAAVYEMRQQRLQANMRKERNAALMTTQKPKPLVMTESGQRQQMKYVRQMMTGNITADTLSAQNMAGPEGISPIAALMGMQMTKRAKKK